MRPDQYRPGGKDYLHVNDDRILKIDQEYISYLKDTAQKNKYGKCMMCFHNDIGQHAHEWINVYPKGTYVRPHFHPDKTEMKIIIEGKMHVVVYNDRGETESEYLMEKEGIFISRIDKGVIHTNIQLTDVVYYEVLDGPYTGRNDSVFPEWTLSEENDQKIREWMQRVEYRYEM